MSAADELYLVAVSDMPVTGGEVRTAIADYAHELANRLRALATAQENTHFTSIQFAAYVGGIRDAADLIDPHANGNG